MLETGKGIYEGWALGQSAFRRQRVCRVLHPPAALNSTVESFGLRASSLTGRLFGAGPKSFFHLFVRNTRPPATYAVTANVGQRTLSETINEKERVLMRLTRMIQRGTALMAAGLLALTPVLAGRPGSGELYYNGQVVRTLVPPATMSKPGRDNLYGISGGVENQRPVAAVAPGDHGYHGGKWAFHKVTWNVPPYLLTSEDEVLAAETADHVDVVRIPANDFKCPIQP